MDDGDADVWTTARLAVAGRRRRRAADRLVRLLCAREVDGDFSLRARPEDPELLAWLRGLVHPDLYTDEFETILDSWLGLDPYGLRGLPFAPSFLAGIDTTNLAPEHVAPFLRRISLAREAPAASELSPESLGRDAGAVCLAVRDEAQRRWGRALESGTPSLPERTVIPHVVHGIWLGKPMPDTSVFWHNYAEGARRYAGQVDFVLWTDVPRSAFDAARREPPPADGPDPLAYPRKLLAWASSHGIHLVNVHEVFHAGAPLYLHPQYVVEMAKQLPRGFTAAGDHLRVEIVYRLGGVYADGDMSFPAGSETLPGFIARVAASEQAFTLNPVPEIGVGNDLFVAPARHPAFALWLQCARLNYARTQPEIFGGLGVMAGRYAGTPDQALRYLAPSRTGRMHHRMLALLGLTGEQLPPVSTAIRVGNELSWVPPPGGERQADAVPGEDAVADVLVRCVTFLRWQLLTREGDLYLSAVDPVVRGLPDPDAAWLALLTVLAEDSTGPCVTSVTDLRRGDLGRLELVLLPPEAELLLDRSARPSHWLGAPLAGAGDEVWLLDERVTRVALRSGPVPPSAYQDVLEPFAEITMDAAGLPAGLWLRSPRHADMWRTGRRFAAVPDGWFGVSLGGPLASPQDAGLGLRPEAVAVLVAGLAPARPVALLAARGTSAVLQPFVARLAGFLDQPVELVETAPVRHDRPGSIGPA